MSRVNRGEIIQNLSLIHQTHEDIDQEQAEIAYLEEAKNLQEYGVLFYKVSRVKEYSAQNRTSENIALATLNYFFVWLRVEVAYVVYT